MTNSNWNLGLTNCFSDGGFDFFFHWQNILFHLSDWSDNLVDFLDNWLGDSVHVVVWVIDRGSVLECASVAEVQILHRDWA